MSKVVETFDSEAQISTSWWHQHISLGFTKVGFLLCTPYLALLNSKINSSLCQSQVLCLFIHCYILFMSYSFCHIGTGFAWKEQGDFKPLAQFAPQHGKPAIGVQYN